MNGGPDTVGRAASCRAGVRRAVGSWTGRVAFAALLCVLSLPGAARAQVAASNATLTGQLVDATTGAPVPNVRLLLDSAPGTEEPDVPERSATSDGQGAFTFGDLPRARYMLSVSTVGYIFVRRAIDLTGGDRHVIVPLAEGTGTYRETVDVESATLPPPRLTAATGHRLGSAGLQELRGVATDDPMRAVQALPGVATGDDFRAEFSVRGSALRHTGIVIDGTPTTLLMHTVRGEANTGSIAMLNTDVLSQVSLLSGAQARRHGDWLGATLQVDVREGSRDRTGLRGAVSGTSASFVAEGPLGSGRRGSWLVSLRRSYLDWLIRKVEPDFDSTLGFYDGYAKIVADAGPRHQVQLLVIAGEAAYRERDASAANGLDRAHSASTLASLSWRYAGTRAIVTQRLSFTGSDFRNTGVRSQELARGYTQGLLWKADVAVPLPRGWTVEAGALRERQRANEIARVFRLATNRLVTAASRDVSPATTLSSLWVQAAREGRDGGVAVGARVSDRTRADGLAISPWVMLERRTGAFSWRAAAGASAQYPDPLLVFGADARVRPEEAIGADLGVEHRVGAAASWRVSMFARRESHGLRPAAEERWDPVANARRPAPLLPVHASSLEGQSRGVEIVLTRQAASGLGGWIGYSWSHTRMRDVATGERFDADFDQRHTLNAVVTGRLSYRTNVGAKLRIGSNTPIVGYVEGTPAAMRLGAQRNAARLPLYARLDLRAARTFTFDARRLTLFVEVMNTLRRENFGQAEGSIRASLEANGFVERLIPMVPSAGLLIEF